MRHYLVDPKVVREFRRRFSRYARASGANEADFHSFVFNHPELVTCYLGEEQSIAWRKEPTFSTKDRLDMLVLFYGRSQCDLIECKGPRQPIIGEHGTTRHLNASLAQLVRYRNAFMNGRASDRRLRTQSKNQPRLILIGDRQIPIPLPEQAALLKAELEGSPQWKREFAQGLLIVTTWDLLAYEVEDKAKKAGFVKTSRWCNNVVKDVLGNFALDRNRRRTSLPSIDEFMEQASDWYDLKGSMTSVKARVTSVIDVLKQLPVLQNRELNPQSLNSQLQIADWMLYEENGDMPCGQWDHSSTYGALDILAKSPLLWTAITGRLLKALAEDSSEDVLGRTSHVLRYAPGRAKKLLLDNRAIRKKWKFPDMEELASEPKRPAVAIFIQLGYCLAHHGDSEAIAFMNRAAATPDVLNDLARWNTLHAKRNPEKLLKALRRKAEEPTADQKPFLPWHKAILEATEFVFRQLKKSRPR